MIDRLRLPIFSEGVFFGVWFSCVEVRVFDVRKCENRPRTIRTSCKKTSGNGTTLAPNGSDSTPGRVHIWRVWRANGFVK